MEQNSLSEQICAVLNNCPHMKKYEISVIEYSHAIVLAGTVNSFFHKQMAQETVGQFLKSKMQQGLMLMLKNDIVVRYPIRRHRVF